MCDIARASSNACGAKIARYERLGYQRRGDVDFAGKPAGHEGYAVYDKRL